MNQLPHEERSGFNLNGFIVLVIWFALAAFLIQNILALPPRGAASGALLTAGLIVLALVLIARGFFTLQPNSAAILTLFGAYSGTCRVTGLRWTNPFYARRKISLRARNLNGERLKVNDRRGNPIEIAAVVVWRVHDTAKASFDIDNYEAYVTLQSEAAVRHLAASYPYDEGDEEGQHEVITLRSGGETINRSLAEELTQRFDKAGVVVEEARLTHLAYAPEIAQVMLRRQQAEAVISARQKIVSGAVGMVDMALHALSEREVVQLDDERRAAMVSNLMVVLCAESEVQPVVNTGTLYS
jgi:regulator of protease activity HflC (stomatin/prohibitin superfamily)